MTARWDARRLGRPRGCAAQYRAVLRYAGDDCLIFLPVGCYVEFYGPQRLVAESVLTLHRAHIPRAGYAFAVGFPRGATAWYARRALQVGVAVVQMGVGRDAVRVPTAVVAPWTARRGHAETWVGDEFRRAVRAAVPSLTKVSRTITMAS